MSNQKSNLAVAAAYDQSNLEHAKFILANPEDWGEDEHPALVKWARDVVERLEGKGGVNGR